MKKKLLLTIVLSFVLCAAVGCGSDTDTENNLQDNNQTQEEQVDLPNDDQSGTASDEVSAEDGNGDASQEETAAVDDDSIVINGNVIRANGKLEDLTQAERYHYLGIVLKAFQELDYDTLTLYARDPEKVDSIKSYTQGENADFWKSIFGNMVYFEDSDLIIYKSPDYICGKWYMDCQEAGVTVPDEVRFIPNEEALEIYNKYYEEAPYVADLLSDVTSSTVEDGYFKVTLSDFFEEMICNLYEITDRNGKLAYATLFMGDEDCFALGYDYIVEDVPEYKELLTLDLGVMCDYVNNNLPEKERNDSSFYYGYYTKYYLDEANRAIVQNYFDENVLAVRSLSSVDMFRPAALDVDYPFYQATDETKAAMASYNVHTESHIYEFTGDFGNGFSFYYDVLQVLIREYGVLE